MKTLKRDYPVHPHKALGYWATVRPASSGGNWWEETAENAVGALRRPHNVRGCDRVKAEAAGGSGAQHSPDATATVDQP